MRAVSWAGKKTVRRSEMIGSSTEPTVLDNGEVLCIAAEGLTARQIAVRLGVAERTVTTHLAHIYGKLGVGGRVEAITQAAKAGLVTVGWLS